MSSPEGHDSVPGGGESRAEALFLGLLVFLIYAYGACRTIYVGDSGELVAAAATLGIPHPSGYPLYVLLGKLWTMLLPLGSIAWRMSLFSVAAAALTCGLFFLLVRRLGAAVPVATIGTGLLAFGPSFWSQANIQRVYSLNALAVVAVTLAAVEWHRTRQIRWMMWAALLAGLGAGNHTFMGVFGLAVGVFGVVTEPGLLKRPRDLLACVGSGLVGLLPYAYLPIRSRMDPRLDWGNPETFEQFWAVVTRRDFWGRAWLETPADFFVILQDYVWGLGEESLWGGLLLAAWGLVQGWRRWPVLLPLFGMLANLWAVGLHGSRSDIFIWHRYYIPSYLMLALLATLGLQSVQERWGRRMTRLAVVLPLALLILGFPRFDRSRFRIAEDFSRQLLESLPPGAHLSASDDNILFVLIYLHLVEKVRPDLHLVLQGVGSADLPTLRFDPDGDPLYFTHHPNWDVPQLDVVPMGLAFKVVRAGTSLPPPKPLKPLAGAEDPRVPKDYLTRNLVGHYHYMEGLTHEATDWSRASQAFRRATDVAFENDVLFYNLGLIYRRNGLWQRALESFERSEAINPRHIASRRPVRARDRVEETRQELQRLDEMQRRWAASRGSDPSKPLIAADYELLAKFYEQAGEVLAARGQRLLAQESRDQSLRKQNH